MSFLTVTIALAQISGNLGLAIRQKSQVMLLFLFVIISFFDEQKFREWRLRQKSRPGNDLSKPGQFRPMRKGKTMAKSQNPY